MSENAATHANRKLFSSSFNPPADVINAYNEARRLVGTQYRNIPLVSSGNFFTQGGNIVAVHPTEAGVAISAKAMQLDPQILKSLFVEQLLWFTSGCFSGGPNTEGGQQAIFDSSIQAAIQASDIVGRDTMFAAWAGLAAAQGGTVRTSYPESKSWVGRIVQSIKESFGEATTQEKIDAVLRRDAMKRVSTSEQEGPIVNAF